MDSKLIEELCRKCIRSALDIIIMSVTKSKSVGAYELIKILENKFEVFLSPEIIYLTLSSLVDDGLIEVEQKREKDFQLIDKGEKHQSLLENYLAIQEEIARSFKSIDSCKQDRQEQSMRDSKAMLELLAEAHGKKLEDHV